MMADGSDPPDGDSAQGAEPHEAQEPPPGAPPQVPGEQADPESVGSELAVPEPVRRPPPPPTPFTTGRGQVPPVRPPDPIGPFIRPPGMRRRRKDWPVLIFALVMAGLVMAGCCIAGFAVYTGYGARIR